MCKRPLGVLWQFKNIDLYICINSDAECKMSTNIYEAKVLKFP